jgi:hypothetical protein
MKRHNAKKLESTGVFEELLKHKFIKNNQVWIFSYWNYKVNKLFFNFVKEEDKDKNPFYDNIEILCNILWHQHINNYEDTLKLNYEAFDEVI